MRSNLLLLNRKPLRLRGRNQAAPLRRAAVFSGLSPLLTAEAWYPPPAGLHGADRIVVPIRNRRPILDGLTVP